jgi:hypothetical protein
VPSDLTFFLLTTPRDVVLADYAVRSYARIRGVNFTLRVYSNYLLPEQKAYYFPRWERLPFVSIQRNDHQDADLAGIKDRVESGKLEGPFEYCDSIWDRELPLIDSPLVATVDADFEVLRPRFVYHMLDALASTKDLIAFSTDHSPTSVSYEPYTRENIILNERNHTWFCIYRREAFTLSNVSHGYYQEVRPKESIRRNAWDSAAYFQKSLRDRGYAFRHLPPSYRRQYIHYGAFSKNTSITRRTVGTFRALVLVEHMLPGRLSRVMRLARARLMPKLENNRYQWVRDAPIQW